MKSKEEIEQLAANLANPNVCKTTNWIEGYNQCKEDMAKDIEYWQGEFEHWLKQATEMADTSKVTRFEVIDENGRAYTEHYCKVELSYQDDGRTLKVFIKPLNKQDNE